jgi:cardiolipin synthase
MTSGGFAIGLLLALIAFFLYRTLFVPPLAFSEAEPLDLDREHALHVVAAVSDADTCEGNTVEVLTDGRNFYPAELEAMREAERSINLEVYIFWAGEVVDQFIEVMSERAAAGVRVNLLVDAVGSYGMAVWRSGLRRLRAAGCHVHFYHPLTPRMLDRINIRTHREIIVVDGRTAFVGGAGIADHWMLPSRGRPWRDMMIQVTGRAATALQGIFVENWLEASGEALVGERFFPECEYPGSTRVLVINSSTRGRSSHTQILHQLLLISARKSIRIVTPYFLPDPIVKEQIVQAGRRGVDVKIITVGSHTDLKLLRAGGRRIYGDLLEAGVDIYEYAPGMFHAKMLLVDDLWSVIGTTNFDNRSFTINDEINLAIADESFCGRLSEDVVRDIGNSRQVSLEEWRHRPLHQRIYEQVSRLVERQQ